jgi:nucleotide-binding universal stress UspA family protein
MYDRILIPLEREKGTEAHLRHAVDLAAGLGAEVTLLRVSTIVPSEEYFSKRVQVEEGSSGAQRKATAENYTARLTAQLRDRGVAAEPVVIVSDKAEHEAIVEYASKSNADLIVLPNQRRSLVSRWLQGNVTAKVQRRSPIPILLVRDED